ncbi:NAD-dependent epimerase/dehydratase family protein [Streptomyces sp. NPDC056165]|uniref:NAD-dependent epimerase/dehydratase family protein n=1 Tax=Streptomyces sp. NPDC056165 TaxID=3345733 RepID=UPI0035E18220
MAGLLGRGYLVRTTVRDAGKSEQVRAAVGEQAGVEAAAAIEVVSADLLADEGWEEAVTGVDYVLHTASPLGFNLDEDLIRIAREGVARVLGAAARAGVKRAVYTSSGVTAIVDHPSPHGVETVWATPAGIPARQYNDSKILAERDAWKIADETGLELSSVLPTFMQGPVLGTPSREGSVEVVRRMLAGGVPAVPNIGWDIVDVRDIARLHILAMTSPAAAGERFLGSGGWLWWRDMARILRDMLPDAPRKVPTRAMPDGIVKLLARFNPQMAALRLDLGKQVAVDSGKARTLLEWHSRPAEQTIIDTATSLIVKNALGK